MATQIFWILLVLIAVAQVEWPLFISSAAELSDTPPENRQEWLHPVIFEPQNKIQLTCSTYQVTTFLALHLLYCKAQPRRASLGYPFRNMAALTEATPTREGI